MTERVTLSNDDDADQFASIREEMGEHRRREPSNAEVVRRLMESWERDQGGRRRR